MNEIENQTQKELRELRNAVRFLSRELQSLQNVLIDETGKRDIMDKTNEILNHGHE
jgi:hypothetical protein